MDNNIENNNYCTICKNVYKNMKKCSICLFESCEICVDKNSCIYCIQSKISLKPSPYIGIDGKAYYKYYCRNCGEGLSSWASICEKCT